MVKDHSDSKRENPLPPHSILFSISRKVSFICTIPQTGEYIPQPLLHQSWSTGWNKKSLNGSTMKDRCDDQSHHEQTLLPWIYISLPHVMMPSTEHWLAHKETFQNTINTFSDIWLISAITRQYINKFISVSNADLTNVTIIKQRYLNNKL